MLNENYHGEIYHFTSLIQASWIVDDDYLSPNIASSEEGVTDKPCISFTRDKNYNIQREGTTVCFVFDGDMIQNIRNARLRPYAFDNYKGEAEERLCDIDVYPLHKYLKRIEIKVSNEEFSWTSDRDFDEEGELYDEFRTRFPSLNELEISHKITDYLISKITNNKLFSGKVIIHNKNINCNINMNKKLIRLTESDLHRIVKESVNRILIESQYNDVKYIVKEHWYCGHSSSIKEYVYYDKVKAQNHVIKYNDDHKFSKSYATVETIVPRDPVADRAKENVARFIKRDWQKFHP